MLNSESFYKKLTVMYVEPNITTSKFFENILKKMFKEIYVFHTSKDALNFFYNKDNHIDFIISDMQLENGIIAVDLLKKIRERDEEIPFILTTGVLDSNELLEAIKNKVTDFLIKPLNAKSLLESVQKICQVKFYEETKKHKIKDFEDIVNVVNEVALVSKTNLDGEIIFVNKSFCEVTGYTEDELINNKHDLIREKSDEVSRSIKGVIHKGEIWEGKIRNITKNNEVFYAYLTVIPIFDEDDVNIKEFTWIRFVATEYELEQKKFRKKVIENINKNRRINIEARDKIDALQGKLNNYMGLRQIYEEEQKRKEKFEHQFNYFDSEAKKNKKKLDELSGKAKEKLSLVLKEQEEVKEKNDHVSALLESVIGEFELKNKTIKELSKELDKQKQLIEKLMLKIDHREMQLGYD